jgi:hypothetical protein
MMMTAFLNMISHNMTELSFIFIIFFLNSVLIELPYIEDVDWFVPTYTVTFMYYFIA